MANIDIEGILQQLPNDGRVPKTKIVCTLGPASRSVEMIEKLLRAGMNVARFNFSHGTHQYHQDTLNNLNTAMHNTAILCALMLDTKISEWFFRTSIQQQQMAEGSAKATDAESTDAILEAALKSATEKGLCIPGDAVVALHRIGAASVIKICVVK